MTSRDEWPLQSACDRFYGDPTRVLRGVPGPDPDWEARNLVNVALPWGAHAAWDSALRVRFLRVHRKCAPALDRVLTALWLDLGQVQAEADRIGLSSIGGGYNWRMMRGSRALSMHAYGCAVDLDPGRNAFGDRPTMDERVIHAFYAEGATWGGEWSKPDGMHFQFARVG